MSYNMKIQNNGSHIYIYGTGGIASEIAELICDSELDVKGFVVDDAYLASNTINNIPVISYSQLLKEKTIENISVMISLGEPKYRRALSEKLLNDAITETGIILSDFVSCTAKIESGTILHYGSFVSTNVAVGKSCLINKAVIIGHDSVIGDYSVISPGVKVGGKVSIGHNCFIGLGACIRDGVSIGDNTIIGMGTVVTKNIDSNVIAVGNPAKLIGINKDNKVFR